MARVIVSLLAQADTAYIVSDLTDKAGYGVAAEYLASFEAVYDRLAVYPDSGSPRAAIGRHIRVGVVSPYIVIYEHDPASDIVTVSRIVHGSRRIAGKLLRGG
jgi:plasmid stabilization system protein ParE